MVMMVFVQEAVDEKGGGSVGGDVRVRVGGVKKLVDELVEAKRLVDKLVEPLSRRLVTSNSSPVRHVHMDIHSQHQEMATTNSP